MSTSKSELAHLYKKVDDIDHVLLKSGMYIGSIETVPSDMWVYDDATESVVQRNINFNYGLYKLFDESVVNVIDHCSRTKKSILEGKVGETPVTQISVNIDPETGKFQVINNGTSIHIEKHPIHGMYIPEMIFAHLRSSTNYDKNEKRTTGGTNGYGIKLVSIFSTWSRIEIVDTASKQKYTQEYKNNLREICPPVVEKLKGAGHKSYISIEFIPDYTRFGYTGFPTEMMSLFKRRTYDIGALVDKNVKVSFNEKLLEVKTFKQYIGLYIGPNDKIVYEEGGSRWEYAVTLSPESEYRQVSWVNGIYTRNGGRHCDYILNQITKKIVDYIEKKKKVSVRAQAIKEQLMLFLRCEVENVEFDSQSKDCLTLPVSKFGSTCTVSDAFCEKVAKMGVMETALNVTQARESREISKKTDGKKTRTIRGVNNFIDANFAGTERSDQCTLILCEGLSAQSGVVSGLSSNDRNFIGIYPLKGKVLNVRGETAAKIAANKEITDLKKILGLENGRTYTPQNFAQNLRYGKVMVLTDADSVTGDTPMLLKNKDGFMEIRTIDDISVSEWEQKDNGKDESQTDYEVWTENGWTKIKRVIRHKVTKQLFRVLTHTGVVDVTEDHSLIDKNKKEITPNEITINGELLHSFPVFDDININFEDVKNMGCKDVQKIASLLNIQYYLNYNTKELLDLIQEKLNSHIKPNTTIGDFGITTEEAYVMGLFWADGTCGVYKWEYTKKPVNRPREYTFHRTSYSWAIVNTNIDYLNKAKEILDKTYTEFEFKIVECDMTNTQYSKSRCFKLLLNGGKTSASVIEKYRSMFYDSNKKKKVPVEILNATTEIKEQFFEGYYDGDGSKGKGLEVSGSRTFDIDGKIGTHGMYLLCKSLGYKVSINTSIKKPKVYTLTLTKGKQQDNPNRIKKIIPLGNTQQYVYDLETENHHFQAGAGEMIVHNTDGHHIKALCINLFHCEWSSLVKIAGFLSFMNTPILRATRGKQTLSFYHEGEYEAWKEEIGEAALKAWKIKYFKGLGTSTSAEFKEYFANKKQVDFVYTDAATDDKIDKVFNKKRADERKTWLENYDKRARLNTSNPTVTYEEFIDKELIHFSVYDCERSIPNLMDGLKISLRKILYCAFKRRMTTEVKVAQFSGYVSEHSMYHHGEASLNGAIINMSQVFTGSNNINLLEPKGQFGTRLQGGDDSASERYIFTQLNELTRAIFPEADDRILTYINDDGTMVEPEFYVPIIPFVLVNGSSGIGTGFSTSIPPYNPRDLVAHLRARLSGAAEPAELVPYYEGFKGTVEKIDDAKYQITGCYRVISDDKIVIDELPVGSWTMPYLTMLEDLADPNAVDKSGKKIVPVIKDMVNLSTETNVHIEITFPKGALAKLVRGEDDSALLKLLKLTTTVSTTNMHLFTAELKLKKYATVDDIISDYYEVRLDAYVRRKKYLMEIMQHELKVMTNKARYITEILEDVIDLRRKTAKQVYQMLRAREFDVILSGVEDSAEVSEENETAAYKYLTKMPMDSVSAENVAAILREKAELERRFAELSATTETQMWLAELDVFEEKYAKYKNYREHILEGDGAAAAGPKKAATAQKKKAVPKKTAAAAATATKVEDVSTVQKKKIVIKKK